MENKIQGKVIEEYSTFVKRYKWIEIVETGKSKSGKTLIFDIVNKDYPDISLGQIKWNADYRKYAFYPSGDSYYEEDCLKDIANYLKRIGYPKNTIYMKKQPTEKEMISRKDGMKGFKIGILMGKQQTFADVMKIIDEANIGDRKITKEVYDIGGDLVDIFISSNYLKAKLQEQKT